MHATEKVSRFPSFQRSYLATVLKEIRSCGSVVDIVVRLLVSIDRRKGVKDAFDTLDLMQEFMAEYGDLIVGGCFTIHKDPKYYFPVCV